MATGTVLLDVLAGVPDSTNPPAVAFTSADRPYLAFDSGTDESLLWTFRLPTDYSSSPVLRLVWSGSSSTTTSHTVVWSVDVMKLDGDTDSVASDSDSFDTANTASDDILGTTAKRPQAVGVTLTNFDSAAADDYVAIRLARDADNGSDDLPEDAWLWAVALEYTTS